MFSGFQIAMHHAHRMRGVEDAHDRRENFKRFRCGEPSAGFDGVVEGMSLDVLHHHVDRSVGSGTQVVNRNCVRMTKASRLPFAPEPSQPLRVVSNLRRQHFYCHAIAEQDVPRPVNCAHAAFAQQRFHLVLPSSTVLTIDAGSASRTSPSIEQKLTLSSYFALQAVQYFIQDLASSPQTGV